MEITGVIEKVLKLELGITKDNKEWQKQNFIVANNDGFEGKKQIFALKYSEKCKTLTSLTRSDTVKVDFNISTNEWKERYFTSLQVWKVFKAEGSKESKKVESVEEEPSDLPF
jgi:hypothetical protein